MITDHARDPQLLLRVAELTRIHKGTNHGGIMILEMLIGALIIAALKIIWAAYKSARRNNPWRLR